MKAFTKKNREPKIKDLSQQLLNNSIKFKPLNSNSFSGMLKYIVNMFQTLDLMEKWFGFSGIQVQNTEMPKW
ncbi:hypothetical protein RCL_jg271.t1 [Rhizophagus clarus]|uniref:Uncharacterized protein n=1 Tax=Rhizophagus clarus TaxID=94130 RepID=A0A8H3M3E8_9GLOM|nr:hypothetical protein RCL_jg271.t1 [Rhizophagus clarus]